MNSRFDATSYITDPLLKGIYVGNKNNEDILKFLNKFKTNDEKKYAAAYIIDHELEMYSVLLSDLNKIAAKGDPHTLRLIEILSDLILDIRENRDKFLPKVQRQTGSQANIEVFTNELKNAKNNAAKGGKRSKGGMQGQNSGLRQRISSFGRQQQQATRTAATTAVTGIQEATRVKKAQDEATAKRFQSSVSSGVNMLQTLILLCGFTAFIVFGAQWLGAVGEETGLQGDLFLRGVGNAGLRVGRLVTSFGLGTDPMAQETVIKSLLIKTLDNQPYVYPGLPNTLAPLENITQSVLIFKNAKDTLDQKNSGWIQEESGALNSINSVNFGLDLDTAIASAEREITEEWSKLSIKEARYSGVGPGHPYSLAQAKLAGLKGLKEKTSDDIVPFLPYMQYINSKMTNGINYEQIDINMNTLSTNIDTAIAGLNTLISQGNNTLSIDPFIGFVQKEKNDFLTGVVKPNSPFSKNLGENYAKVLFWNKIQGLVSTFGQWIENAKEKAQALVLESQTEAITTSDWDVLYNDVDNLVTSCARTVTQKVTCSGVSDPTVKKNIEKSIVHLHTTGLKAPDKNIFMTAVKSAFAYPTKNQMMNGYDTELYMYERAQREHPDPNTRIMWTTIGASSLVGLLVLLTWICAIPINMCRSLGTAGKVMEIKNEQVMEAVEEERLRQSKIQRAKTAVLNAQLDKVDQEIEQGKLPPLLPKLLTETPATSSASSASTTTVSSTSRTIKNGRLAAAMSAVSENLNNGNNNANAEQATSQCAYPGTANSAAVVAMAQQQGALMQPGTATTLVQNNTSSDAVVGMLLRQAQQQITQQNMMAPLFTGYTMPMMPTMPSFGYGQPMWTIPGQAMVPMQQQPMLALPSMQQQQPIPLSSQALVPHSTLVTMGGPAASTTVASAATANRAARIAAKKAAILAEQQQQASTPVMALPSSATSVSSTQQQPSTASVTTGNSNENNNGGHTPPFGGRRRKSKTMKKRKGMKKRKQTRKH